MNHNGCRLVVVMFWVQACLSVDIRGRVMTNFGNDVIVTQITMTSYLSGSILLFLFLNRAGYQQCVIIVPLMSMLASTCCTCISILFFAEVIHKPCTSTCTCTCTLQYLCTCISVNISLHPSSLLVHSSLLTEHSWSWCRESEQTTASLKS